MYLEKELKINRPIQREKKRGGRKANLPPPSPFLAAKKALLLLPLWKHKEGDMMEGSSAKGGPASSPILISWVISFDHNGPNISLPYHYLKTFSTPSHPRARFGRKPRLIPGGWRGGGGSFSPAAIFPGPTMRYIRCLPFLLFHLPLSKIKWR